MEARSHWLWLGLFFPLPRLSRGGTPASFAPVHMPFSCPARIVAAVLGGVFVWAGLSKITDVAMFAVTVGEFGLVWEPLLSVTAWLVIGVELLAGGGLWFGRRWAIAVAAGLVMVFLCVLGYGIILGLDIECGCFGAGDGRTSLTLTQAAAVDSVLLVACAGLAWATRSQPLCSGNGESDQGMVENKGEED